MNEAQAVLRREMMEGQAALRSEMLEDYGRIMDHLFRIVRDLGEVKGELKRIAPREKATAAGS